jgi:hypothetical protein
MKHINACTMHGENAQFSNVQWVLHASAVFYMVNRLIQGPAEIPDGLQTQLRVEPLACGICP